MSDCKMCVHNGKEWHEEPCDSCCPAHSGYASARQLVASVNCVPEEEVKCSNCISYRRDWCMWSNWCEEWFTIVLDGSWFCAKFRKEKKMDDRKFTVKGIPVPKARPRVTRTGHAYTPKKTADYEKRVRKAYEDKYNDPLPDDIPIYMDIVFYMPIPKSWTKKKQERARREEIFPTGKPDLDNLYKGIADALNGVAYHDDSQVVYCVSRSAYSDEPRAEVCIGEYR